MNEMKGFFKSLSMHC